MKIRIRLEQTINISDADLDSYGLKGPKRASNVLPRADVGKRMSYEHNLFFADDIAIQWNIDNHS